MNSFKESREKLIEFLQNNGITDNKVIEAFKNIPRHFFVPEVLKFDAYKNSALPIGNGQTISQPLTVAMMTQALELDENHSVLEIGTGSGFQTAILAFIADRVFTVERFKEFTVRARKIHEELKLMNIVYRIGDGSYGWAQFAPFDRIIATAAFEKIPEILIKQLKINGILISPLKSESSQFIIKIKKLNDKVEEEFLKECNFVEIIWKLLL